MINSYHSKSYEDLQFLITKKEKEPTYYVGAELEVENTSLYYASEHEQYAEEVANILGDMLFDIEEDSSLANDGDSGFEIITNPMSKDFWLNNLDKFKQAFEYLQKSGYTSHDSGRCGLHFHISKQAFGNTQEEIDKKVGKLILIFETYKKELTTFGRRGDYESYSKWLSYSTNINNKAIKSGKILSEINKDKHDRYLAINTTNPNTIEIRFIRGTLRYET